MRTPRHPRLIRLGRLHRGLALLFLLFTLADMSSPGSCSEALFGLPNDLFAHAESAHDSGASRGSEGATSSVPSRQSDSQPAHADEDCFCCCAHLLASRVFFYDVASADVCRAKPAEYATPSFTPPIPSPPPRVS